MDDDRVWLPPRYQDVPGFDPATVRTVTVTTVPQQPGSGVYVPTVVGLRAGDSPVILARLCGGRPGRWAAAVVTAACQARHEQAVYALFTLRLAMEGLTAAHALALLREQRSPTPAAGDTAPLTFEPILTARTGAMTGVVRITMGGVGLGSWTPEEAVGHAAGVLEAEATAVLDSALWAALATGDNGEPDLEAGAAAFDAVQDLASFAGQGGPVPAPPSP